MAQTITQGKSFVDTGGRTGIAQYNPNTGAPLSAGQSVNINPSGGGSTGGGAVDTKGNPVTPSAVDTLPPSGGWSQYGFPGNPNNTDAKAFDSYNMKQPNINGGTGPTPRVGDQIPGTNLKYEASDIANLSQPSATAGSDLKNTMTGALNDLQKNGGTVPTTLGAANEKVQSSITQNTPQPTQTNPMVDPIAQTPEYTQKIADYTAFMNSVNQRQSLTDIYSTLSQQLGIPALNTELMNMNKVINGTEQDIRDEVSKSGGFATNSQILALSSARNKQLIANYHDLVQARTDLNNQLTTMIGLSEKDRASADAVFSEQLKFDQQMVDYRDKAITHAQSNLDIMQKSEGWDGIYKAALASGDPQAIANINATMGQGFDLTSMANADAQARTQKQTMDALDIKAKNASINSSNASTAKTIAETQAIKDKALEDSGAPNPAKAGQPGYSNTGVKYTVQSATQALTNHWVSSNAQGKDGYVSPQTYNAGLAEWVQNNLSASDYKAIFGGYVNPKDSKLIN